MKLSQSFSVCTITKLDYGLDVREIAVQFQAERRVCISPLMAPVGLQCVAVVVSSGYNGRGLSLTTYPIQFPVEVQFH
jgi:hypothetical protein